MDKTVENVDKLRTGCAGYPQIVENSVEKPVEGAYVFGTCGDRRRNLPGKKAQHSGSTAAIKRGGKAACLSKGTPPGPVCAGIAKNIE